MTAYSERNLIRKDLLYPDLSYQIVGVLFEVSKALGHKYHERYYQRAIADAFRSANIGFREQAPVALAVNGRRIAKGNADFVVEGRVILEIKKGERFLKQNIDQLFSYLISESAGSPVGDSRKLHFPWVAIQTGRQYS